MIIGDYLFVIDIVTVTCMILGNKKEICNGFAIKIQYCACVHMHALVAILVCMQSPLIVL